MNNIKEFNYLDVIPLAVMGMPVSFCREYHTSGARKSGKTRKIRDTIANTIACAYKTNKKVGIIAVRQMNKDVRGTIWDEIIEGINELGFIEGVHYKIYISLGIIEFSNGSKILCKGLHTSSSNKVSLKALKSFTGYDWLIDWQEEANEIDKKSRQALIFALRGCANRITITSCNPDSIYNDHIKYLNERYPFNENLLTLYGSQRKVIKENNIYKSFHYTNWKINHFLTEVEIQDLKELEIKDPIKARIWSLGMPGSIGGSVFTRYINSCETTLNFVVDEISGGIDLGNSDAPSGHPTTASFWLISNLEKKAYKEAEYYHNNADMVFKDPDKIARDIIEFYLIESQLYADLRYKLTIHVDYGAGGLYMINILNKLKYEYGNLSWMNFIGVNKEIWFRKDRLEYFQMMLIYRKFGYNWKRCPNTYRQYGLMAYKEIKNNEENKLELSKINDDCWDADCYALMNKADSFMQTIKNIYIRQGLRY